MSGHDKLSPSSRYRYKACPGSVNESKKYPEKPSGPSAIDGTHTHTLLEHCVKSGLIQADTMVGQLMTDHEGSFHVEADRAERVQLVIDYVRSRMAQLGSDCQLWAERKVDPSHMVGRHDMKGTVDITLVSQARRTIEIIDLKDGFDPVSADGNEQMEVYAVGVLSELKLPINAVYPYDIVTMTIIQPKLRIKHIEPISSSTVTVQHILGQVGQMALEAHLTEQSDAKLVPGEKQCKYCNAAGNCVAQVNQAMNGIGIMFQPVQQLEVPSFLSATPAPEMPSFLGSPATVPAVVQNDSVLTDISHQAANKDPATMSNEQLAKVLEAAPLVRQMIKVAEEEAMTRMKKGITIPGFKAVNGNGSRHWAFPEDEMAAKLIAMGIPKSAVYKTELVSPAQCEKLTWEKTSKGEVVKKSLSARQLKTLETEYISKVAGKLTIAPESDSRAAVTLNAAPLFAAIAPQPEAEPVAELPDWMK